VRASHVREMARFEIEDTGPGMAPTELARVFEPFARGSAAGGSGAARHRPGPDHRQDADRPDGRRDDGAQQRPAQGTLFRVRLFLPELRAARAAAAAAARMRLRRAAPPLLVVDNEEADRDAAGAPLQPLGFEVLQAASGEAALALLQAEPPDAIFMDLAMPGIDGWETIRRCAPQRLSDAPVAIVSANAFDKGLDNDVGITPRLHHQAGAHGRAAGLAGPAAGAAVAHRAAVRRRRRAARAAAAAAPPPPAAAALQQAGAPGLPARRAASSWTRSRPPTRVRRLRGAAARAGAAASSSTP
jgi:CheY-like chemotaxis protein